MEQHNQGDDGQAAVQPAEIFPDANICIENVCSLRDSVVHPAGPSLHSTPNNATRYIVQVKEIRGDTVVSNKGVIVYQKSIMAASTQTCQLGSIDSSPQNSSNMLVNKYTQTDSKCMCQIMLSSITVEKPRLDKKKFYKRRERSKIRHFCIYCKKVIRYLTKHLKVVHKDEKEVARILNLNPLMRRKAVQRLARRGDYYYNLNVLANKEGKLIVAREPNRRDPRKYSYRDYACCPYCKVFVRKYALDYHQKIRCSAAMLDLEVKVEEENLAKMKNESSNNSSEARQKLSPLVSLISDSYEKKNEGDDSVKIKIEHSASSTDDLIEADFSHLETDLAVDPLNTDDLCVESNNIPGDGTVEIRSVVPDSILARLLSLSGDKKKGERVSRLVECGSSVTEDLEASANTSLETAPVIQPRSALESLSPTKHSIKKSEKIHCCVYCMKVVTDVYTHFQIKHKFEKEVSRLLKINNARLRASGFIALARKGDYCHNLKVLATEKGELILTRNLKVFESKKYPFSDFGCCSHCLGFMLKQNLESHEKECFMNPAKVDSKSFLKTASEPFTNLLVGQKCATTTDTATKINAGNLNDASSCTKQNYSSREEMTSRNLRITRTSFANSIDGGFREYVHCPKRKWTNEEQDAVMSFYHNHIIKRITPNKEDVLMCKKQYNALSARSWTEIKDFVYNKFQPKQKTNEEAINTNWITGTSLQSLKSDQLQNSTALREKLFGDTECNPEFAKKVCESDAIKGTSSVHSGVLDSEEPADTNMARSETLEIINFSPLQRDKMSCKIDDSESMTTNEHSQEKEQEVRENNYTAETVANLDTDVNKLQMPDCYCDPKPRAKVKRRSWTAAQHNALVKFYGNHIRNKKVPRKEDAEECIRLNPVLDSRTWREVKAYIYNQIVKSKNSK